MSRRWLPLFVLLFAPGCVPSNDPLSDPEKAEPDKALLGEWTADEHRVTFSVPEVKGNPKGLMRLSAAGPDGGDPQHLWFSPTKLGKHTYANVLMTPGTIKDKDAYAQFDKEGGYAKWAKDAQKWVVVALYAVEGDTLTINQGDFDAAATRMSKEKFALPDHSGKGPMWYKTPAGWMAEFLTKNGPDEFFPPKPARAGGQVVKLTRAKPKK